MTKFEEARSMAKVVHNRATEANRLLREAYDLCYKNESNVYYDALHDNLYYQISGLNSTLDEFEAVEKTLDPHLIEAYIKEFEEVIELAKKIKEYYKSTSKISKLADDLNWIYA